MSEWNINGDWKIRLNLSTLSLDVIAQDIEICGAKSRTAFLNNVFLGYYPQARASVRSCASGCSPCPSSGGRKR